MINNLDEAISHTREKAKEILKANEEMPTDCKLSEGLCECAKEHEQLAEWLEELKEYREGKRTCENCKHQNKAGNQYPCSICRNNHANYFEWAKENEVTNEQED